MANVLSNLAADIYTAKDQVARELVGVITSATLNTSTEGAAVGDVIRSAITRDATVVDITPSMTIPEGTDQTVDSTTMTISKARAVQIPWTGEDIKHVNNGAGFETIYGNQIKQAMRKIVNEMEIDAATEVYKNASRSVGTPGTTPFASNFNIINSARQVLVDNGCAIDGEVSLILNTLAGTNLRNLAQLQKASEAGGTELLRQGTLIDLSGLMLKESAGIRTTTKGTGASYLINNGGGYAIGATSLVLDTGTGTILAGDILTIGGVDYVVDTALTGGTVIINKPGLVAAVADNAAVTVGNNRTANVLFHRSAVEVAMRPPAVPLGGDAAVDSMDIFDEYSGLVFQVNAYKGYKKAMFEVAAAWGQKAWKDEFIASIAG